MYPYQLASLQIYGINPYQQYVSLSSEHLAAKIIRSIKAPHTYSVERTYARHIALMVSRCC
jgi:hypothetical protein